MTTHHFIAQIRDLIARDEFPEALEQLRNFLGNTPKMDEILQQSGRFHDIRKQIRLGLVSHAEANLTKNQIRAGVLDLLSEVEKQGAVQKVREEIEDAISIINSKNVVVGSTITAGGNVHIGDKTTQVIQNAEKIYNINHIDNANFD